ncbi:MAG: MBL fold metallo-hydrolase [Nanoarchaeota archaeon]|nr:MBL fold metallo-hydrolase [Nanoarchaeota archaeon]
MQISVVASGSNGNSCLIENKGTSLLIDAGKSCREIERRLNNLGTSLENVNAILLTHAHSDHIAGVDVISRRYNIPVYLSKDVYEQTNLNTKTKIFSKSFKINNLKIKPIQTSHDVPSTGFKINDFGIFTDTGIITKEIEKITPKLKGILLESNHDIDMLINGSYPAFLKQRILSDRGHLSNIHASELIEKQGKNLNFALLGHLSANNNTVRIVKHTFETIVKKKLNYNVLSREKESGVWDI